MVTGKNYPYDEPKWQAINRECHSVRMLIGPSADELLNANFAEGIGHYYTAFFGLSTGIERLAKLVLIADYIIENNGESPDTTIIKSYGHDLIKLLDKVEEITTRLQLNLKYERPRNDISTAIIDCLNSFANGGRYGNLDFLSNSNFNNEQEPLNKWWRKVANPILDKHCSDEKTKQIIQTEVKIRIREYKNDDFCVFYIDETGNIITDLRICFERAVKTESVQKFGRYYTLIVARWLAEVFMFLSEKWGGDTNCLVLSGHFQHFQPFIKPDKILIPQKKCP